MGHAVLQLGFPFGSPAVEGVCAKLVDTLVLAEGAGGPDDKACGCWRGAPAASSAELVVAGGGRRRPRPPTWLLVGSPGGRFADKLLPAGGSVVGPARWWLLLMDVGGPRPTWMQNTCIPQLA